MNELIAKGGVLMWPLIVCSVITITVVIERLFFWIKINMQNDQKLINRIFENTEKGNFETVIKETAHSKCMVCRTLSLGLAHRNYGLEENLEAAAGTEIASMKRGLSILDTIITAAPLLGILGTVSGIIVSFDMLGSSGIGDPKAVAGGIAQALITTAAGLTVAIVALLPHNALVRKLETATYHLEKMCTCYTVTVQKGEEKRKENQ